MSIKHAQQHLRPPPPLPLIGQHHTMVTTWQTVTLISTIDKKYQNWYHVTVLQIISVSRYFSQDNIGISILFLKDNIGIAILYRRKYRYRYRNTFILYRLYDPIVLSAMYTAYTNVKLYWHANKLIIYRLSHRHKKFFYIMNCFYHKTSKHGYSCHTEGLQNFYVKFCVPHRPMSLHVNL